MNKQSIISEIQREFSGRFRVFDNTGIDKKVIAGQFPDVILMRPEPPVNQDILFVMKIEDGKRMLDSVPEWKDLGGAPSVLYIVVPEENIDEAKKLASATNVKARFAAYTLDDDDLVEGIRYE